MLAVSADKMSPRYLARMVRFINQHHVDVNDRLSNNVYYYNKATRLLMLCKDSKEGLGDCE